MACHLGLPESFDPDMVGLEQLRLIVAGFTPSSWAVQNAMSTSRPRGHHGRIGTTKRQTQGQAIWLHLPCISSGCF